MDKIEFFFLRNLRNNEHYQFMADVDNLIEKLTPEALKIEMLYGLFKESLLGEDLAMRLEHGSIKSKSLGELDQLREKTWGSILSKVKATQNCPIIREVESAHILKRVLDLYGNIRTLNYNEESAALNNLVNDLLLPANEEHLKNLGLVSWVGELKNQNDDFKDIINERNSEYAIRSNVNVRSARQLVDPIYGKMVDKVNAIMLLEMATPETMSFASELNEEIKYYKTTLATRSGRKDEEEKLEEA